MENYIILKQKEKIIDFSIYMNQKILNNEELLNSGSLFQSKIAFYAFTKGYNINTSSFISYNLIKHYI